MNIAKKWQILLIIIVMTIHSNAQVTDSIYYNRLYFTCKVWGHVKYYHTRIAMGLVNWDNALLEFVKAIKTAPDNIAFNDSLLIMLGKAGSMDTNSNALPTVPDSLNNNRDLAWIQDPIFSDSVKAILDTIRVRFRPQSNTYVGEAWDGGNPTFIKDSSYFFVAIPDEGKRILALFRYWNIINYFYPYKYLIDQSWDKTLKDFIPKIVNANDISYHLSFKEFTTKINDSHTLFYSPTYRSWDGDSHPPFFARFIENEMVITKVLPGNDVAQGDIIKKIDGIDIYYLRDSLRKYAHGSNDVIIERTLNEIILWGAFGSFPITVSNGHNEKTVTLSRNLTNYNELLVNNSSMWQHKIVNGGCHFGIVDMEKLQTTYVKTMFNDLWDTDAIIFDIRNYPQGTLWEIVNYLYSSPLHIANYTVPDITYPGILNWNEELIGSGTSNPYSGKILILFDERTQSQAEYTCMGLEQFPDAIKIGSTTAGADGNCAMIYLPGNIATYVTFLGTYYPDYTQTQRVGIIPDYEVHPTIQGIRNHQDEVMNFALNCESVNNNEAITINEIIKLYPNPAKDYLNYELSSNKPILFEIYDILGRKQKTIYEVLPSGIIDLSGLKSGIYIIKIVVNSEIQIKKIIKK